MEFRKKTTVQKCGLTPSKETEVPPTWALKRHDQRAERRDDALKTGILSPWFTGVRVSGISRHLKKLVARRQTLDNVSIRSQPGTNTIQGFLPFPPYQSRHYVLTVTIPTLPQDFIKKKIRIKSLYPYHPKITPAQVFNLYLWTLFLSSPAHRMETHERVRMSGHFLSYRPSLHKGDVSA